MNYHNITKDDMLNGNGLRVVLWVAGCGHNCYNCQNPITHDPNGGIPFDKEAWLEIREQLDKPYIDGITFSGGDPLHENNRETINSLIDEIRTDYPNKTIWLYTGYTWEQIRDNDELFPIVTKVDILCEGRFIEQLKGQKHWVGSTNQRVIDINKTFEYNDIVELKEYED